MKEEKDKSVMSAALAVFVLVLLADCAWLHVKCARQEEALRTQASAVATLNAAFQAHLNPSPEPSLTDKAKDVYDRAKTAAVEGYEKVKAAASAGYRAVRDECNKK